MTYKARYIKKTQYEILLLESMLLYFSNVQYIKSISKLFCLFSLDLLSKEGLKPVLQRSSNVSTNRNQQETKAYLILITS